MNYQVCYECGKKYGERMPSEGITWWYGVCEICQSNGSVTDERDFGYLDEKKIKIKRN